MNDAPQVAPRVDSQLEVYDEVQEGGGKVNSAFYEEAEQALYDDINNGAQDGKHLSSAGVRDSRGEEVYAEANEEEYMNPDCLQGQGEPEETYEVRKNSIEDFSLNKVKKTVLYISCVVSLNASMRRMRSQCM